jgi:hypothetical protein
MRLLQGSAVGFVLTVAIGFNWVGPGFGWVTGGTVDKIADKRAETAVIAVLAPICAEKFLAQPDIAAKKVAFLSRFASSSYVTLARFSSALRKREARQTGERTCTRGSG